MDVFKRIAQLLVKLVLVVSLVILLLFIINIAIDWTRFIIAYWSMSTQG